MALTKEALKAFRRKARERGYSVKSPKIKTAPIRLIHAVFSGYCRNFDALTDFIQNSVEQGAIIQNNLKGYLFFSYPDDSNGKNLFHSFREELQETENHLRYIGNADKLPLMGGL